MFTEAQIGKKGQLVLLPYRIVQQANYNQLASKKMEILTQGHLLIS